MAKDRPYIRISNVPEAFKRQVRWRCIGDSTDASRVGRSLYALWLLGRIEIPNDQGADERLVQEALDALPPR